ncbi:DUF3383 domain-containing protein [Pseudomonas resinovorans]|uniref:DUF3383 domain-containing protein n=1 Tax=Metapseudomonas resinovorans TaxID=53412 RepID=A0ABT4YAQ0_METRE|nr:DUF3383 domain-containing protein [Pseudomonas resinovorans]MDA8485848.1 DUF3383 domain-containing protein [Pseudomonas resinovorans]
MSIPASAIVQVNPSLLVPGGNDLELNGVIVVDDNRIPPGAVLPFASADDMKAYLGPSAIRAGQLADIYFAGFKNSDIKPRVLYLARWVAEDSAPYVVGQKLSASLADLQAIDDGTLSLSMGGQTRNLIDLDFTGASSFSAVAAIVQSAMVAAAAADATWLAATCTYSSDLGAFVIGSTVAGAALIAAPTGTAADAMSLVGGTVFRGADAQSPTETMVGVIAVTTNWVTFTAARGFDVPVTEDAEEIEFAQWANSKGVRYLYCLYSGDPDLLVLGNTTNIGHQLQELGLSAVAAQWNSIDYAVFLMGMAASIDYSRANGAITTAFKSQEGLAFNVADGTTAAQLEANGFNYYGDWATANDQFRFFYPGQMFGERRWIDVYLNATWLNNALQVALMAGLTVVKRVPYNEAGYTQVRAWMQDPVQRALDSGVIDEGIVLSESQKADVNARAGMNIASQLEISGYYIQVLDPGPVARAARQSPIINFWYTYGGSIQRLVVASQAIV